MATLTHYGYIYSMQLEANLVRIAHESAARDRQMSQVELHLVSSRRVSTTTTSQLVTWLLSYLVTYLLTNSAAGRPAPRAHRLVAGPQPDTLSGPQQHAAPPAAAAAARAQQHAGRGAAAPGCHDARRPDRHALMHQAKDSREQRSKAR